MNRIELNSQFLAARREGRPIKVYKVCRFDEANQRFVSSNQSIGVLTRIYELGVRTTGFADTPLFCYATLETAQWSAWNLALEPDLEYFVLECIAECPVATPFDYTRWGRGQVAASQFTRSMVLRDLKEQVSTRYPASPIVVLAKSLRPEHVMSHYALAVYGNPR